MLLQWISLCSLFKETLNGINQSLVSTTCCGLFQKLHWCCIEQALCGAFDVNVNSVQHRCCESSRCLAFHICITLREIMHHFTFSLLKIDQKSCKMLQISFVRVFPFLFQKARHLICFVLFSIRMWSSLNSKQQNKLLSKSQSIGMR